MKQTLISAILTLFLLNPVLSQSSKEYSIPPNIMFSCPPCGCQGDTEPGEGGSSCTHCGMGLVAKFTDEEIPVRNESNTYRHRKVGILIFNGVQIIDFTGPYEVFGQAGMEVFTVAESDDLIRTAMGMNVKPTHSFESAPEFDILVLPGGGVGRHVRNEKIQNWVKSQVHSTETTLSVCNGAFFLANTGLLDGKRATTFASLIPSLQEAAPKATIVSDERFVDNGKIVTSAGLSSGIDGALHVVSECLGIGRTQEIATNLEYDWDPDGRYVRAALADNLLTNAANLLHQFTPKTIRFEGNEHKWVSQYFVPVTFSAEKLSSLIEAQFILGDGWRKQSSTGPKSKWTFESPKGEIWSGEVLVEPASDDHGLVVTYRIEN